MTSEDASWLFGAVVSDRDIHTVMVGRETGELVRTEHSEEVPIDEVVAPLIAVHEMAELFGDDLIAVSVPDEVVGDTLDNDLFAFDTELDGVLLVPATAALLIGAALDGTIGDARTVAVVDIGAHGTAVTVVDMSDGEVLSRTEIDSFGGNICDETLAAYLENRYGEIALPREDKLASVRTARRELGTHWAATVPGPFGRATTADGQVRLHRSTADLALQPLLGDFSEEVSAVLSAAHPDLVVGAGDAMGLNAIRRAVAGSSPTTFLTPAAQPDARGVAWVVGSRTIDDFDTGAVLPPMQRPLLAAAQIANAAEAIVHSGRVTPAPAASSPAGAGAAAGPASSSPPGWANPANWGVGGAVGAAASVVAALCVAALVLVNASNGGSQMAAADSLAATGTDSSAVPVPTGPAGLPGAPAAAAAGAPAPTVDLVTGLAAALTSRAEDLRGTAVLAIPAPILPELTAPESLVVAPTRTSTDATTRADTTQPTVPGTTAPGGGGSGGGGTGTTTTAAPPVTTTPDQPTTTAPPVTTTDVVVTTTTEPPVTTTEPPTTTDPPTTTTDEPTVTDPPEESESSSPPTRDPRDDDDDDQGSGSGRP